MVNPTCRLTGLGGRAFVSRLSEWIGLIGLLGLVATATASVPTAREVIQQTSDDMLALIEESGEYAKEDPERFFVAVEALLRPVVDFSGFARNVMALHYKKATEEQRSRFAESFKWVLVRSYALALTGFSDGEVVLIPAEKPPRKPNQARIKMEIRTRTGEVYPLIYSMALGKDGVWRMRNIVVNGVNIGLTYRNQFASAATAVATRLAPQLQARRGDVFGVEDRAQILGPVIGHLLAEGFLHTGDVDDGTRRLFAVLVDEDLLLDKQRDRLDPMVGEAQPAVVPGPSSARAPGSGAGR